MKLGILHFAEVNLTMPMGARQADQPELGCRSKNRYTLMDATLKESATWQHQRTAVSTQTQQATM